MNELLTLFVVAAVVEAVWEALKPAWPQGLKRWVEKSGFPLDVLGTIGLSILTCSAAGLDLLTVVGVPLKVPFLGNFLTGILVARGSNFLHDLVDVINGIKHDKKPLKIEAGM